MAASRPLGRAAYNFSNIIRSSSPLTATNGSTYALGRRFGYLAKTHSLLHHHLRLLQFPTGACGYCSQQVAHSSTTHACTPMRTPTQSPTHAAAVSRRINRRTELDFEELRALQVAGDIALIDVREPQELEKHGEIPGSLNIPLCKIKVALQLSEDEWEREFCIEKPDKGDRNLVFYARGPNASSAAVEIAHRLGFKRSRHYIGGWEDYCKQTGQPLKKSQDDGFGACNNYYNNKFDQYFL
ncbi:uncharacterized protein LOC121877872 isoform X2 [Homarus americanus]|uniref:uncharacterized protein LOC121877872 isoform X2 n=1 Tax=Homarus americanus TaxID=6706 RepID=UPI001C48F2B5|nr:uncharacterized protein LOC121877872 isoform X2 [Homarus americanus]